MLRRLYEMELGHQDTMVASYHVVPLYGMWDLWRPDITVASSHVGSLGQDGTQASRCHGGWQSCRTHRTRWNPGRHQDAMVASYHGALLVQNAGTKASRYDGGKLSHCIA